MLLRLELPVPFVLLMNQQNQGQKDKYYKLLSELGQPSVDITEFPLGPATDAY